MELVMMQPVLSQRYSRRQCWRRGGSAYCTVSSGTALQQLPPVLLPTKESKEIAV